MILTGENRCPTRQTLSQYHFVPRPDLAPIECVRVYNIYVYVPYHGNILTWGTFGGDQS